MTDIWNISEIRTALEGVDVVQAMADGFASYSQGRAVVPPVGELIFDEPPGDAHIKYGYLKDDRWFVIKVATGFYDNPKIGLPSNAGLILIFDARTGIPHAVLLDEGHLTNVRTAAAGALAAKLLAPKNVTRIGIIGSGVQARMQLEMLRRVTPCRKVLAFARESAKALAYKEDMEAVDFEVDLVASPAQVAASANLIVTTTAAREPLLFAEDIRPGTHITAMGSDTPDKNEIAGEVLGMADLVVADSVAQCVERGEIFHAVGEDKISIENVVEIGTLALDGTRAGQSEEAITIADLTGVAVQDIEISKAVLAKLTSSIEDNNSED